METYSLTELGYRIWIDRYALKDVSRNSLSIGDNVLVVMDDEYNRRELGYISDINGNSAYVVTDNWENWVSLDKLDKPIELDPDQMHRRVAKDIASKEKSPIYWEEQFYKELKKWNFVPAGRILTAAGNPGQLTYQNCFVLPSPKDSRNGIFERLSQMAEIMSRGGGVGINMSSLRPKNAIVRGVNGRSSGSVSWGSLFSTVTGLIEQSGSRRGALMIILADWHPDILEFINSKKTAGKITNANISVAISDQFMRAVELDLEWDLIFPDTSHSLYDETWDGNLDKWILAGGTTKIYGSIPAKELWNKIVESAWDSAEPGIWFQGTNEYYSNSWYYNPIVASNPCVTGDTRLHTQYGMIKMKELCEKQSSIMSTVDTRSLEQGKGTVVREAKPVFMTSSSAKVYKITTNKGYEIKATDWHELYTNNGKKAVKDIKVGEKLLIQSGPGQWGTEHNPNMSLLMGLIAGDGWISNGRAHIGFWGSDIPYSEKIAEIVTEIVDKEPINNRHYPVGVVAIPTKNKVTISSERLLKVLESYGFTKETKQRVPDLVWKGDKETVVEYIKGLFETDGTVNVSSFKNSCSARLSQSDLPFLKEIQILLSNFGIFCSVLSRRKAKWTLLPDGKGGNKEYWTKESYELIINGESLRIFMENIGFISDRKNNKFRDWAKGKIFKKTQSFEADISSIEYMGEEPVYDTTQPDHNSVIFNGIVSGQCAEQGLPAWSVCNLGTINLNNFYDPKTGVDWNKLSKTISIAVRFLDDVIDVTPYFFKEIEDQQKGERRIGLSTMGLADLLIKNKIVYGSDESVTFIDELYHFMSIVAYNSSIILAEEKGSFPKLDIDKYLQSGFMKNMPINVRVSIMQKGIRNVTILTSAPTGTTGTMLNLSTGIEPYFAFKWNRKSRLGSHIEYMKIAQDYMIENGLSKLSDLPEWFITSGQIEPLDHVKVQAAIQRWNDSAISKTVNLPATATIEDVSKVYETMYKSGIKGGTIYRDLSRNIQVLNNIKTCPECKSENYIIEGKCETCKDCGFSKCNL